MSKQRARLCASGLVVAFSLMLAAHAQTGGPSPDPLAPLPSPTETSVEREPTEAEIAEAKAQFMAGLHPKTGKVAVAGGKVTLNVPPDFIYLDPTDTERVLEKAWGNPPDALSEGMIMAAGSTPFDARAWGAILQYEESGHVSDQDAAKIDYDDLLKTLRSQQEAANVRRVQQNFPALELVGWATRPRYDAASHKLFWARELAVKDEPEHGLNYDMRVLGRTGVLSVNFIAGMKDIDAIEAAGPKVLAFTDFNAGSRYQDFDKKKDKEAEFGLVGLIAGGAVAAGLVAKNTGLLAIALIFLKKAAVFLIAGAVAAGGALMRFLKGRNSSKPPSA